MNVSKIVSAALKQLGVLAAGENASGEEVADAVEALQDILSQWATHKLYVYKVVPITINLVNGQGEHAHSDLVIISNKAVLDGAEVTLVRDTNETKTVGASYRIDNPNWVFFADGNKLEIKAHTMPIELAPHDELHLPKQYERALKLTLAIEIAPMFGVEPSSALVVNQRNAINLLKRANITPLYVKNSLNIGLS